MLVLFRLILPPLPAAMLHVHITVPLLFKNAAYVAVPVFDAVTAPSELRLAEPPEALAKGEAPSVNVARMFVPLGAALVVCVPAATTMEPDATSAVIALTAAFEAE
ncbi:MAG TPA: hypothetical protein VN736_01245 [Candidatus Limnocylindrales bacterium]|nr:hypothetical protein [Candidatus Limnocylindrales bacterium]